MVWFWSSICFLNSFLSVQLVSFYHLLSEQLFYLHHLSFYITQSIILLWVMFSHDLNPSSLFGFLGSFLFFFPLLVQYGVTCSSYPGLLYLDLLFAHM